MTSLFSASRSTMCIVRVENSSSQNNTTINQCMISTMTREMITLLMTCPMKTRGCNPLPIWMRWCPKQNTSWITMGSQSRLSTILARYPVAPQISRLTTNMKTTELQTAMSWDKMYPQRRWFLVLWITRESKSKFLRAHWNQEVCSPPVISFTKSRLSLSTGPSIGKIRTFMTCAKSSARIIHIS